ncbi:MAG: transcription termination/antitermination protein NusA [Deltaproteobacteria bacterium]|nr:transcription termination/antitermination protein NusA [Deltaproteobacteria bacterium]
MAGGTLQELDRVLEQISREKNIPKDKLIEVVEAAILTAARKKWGHLGELEAHYDSEKGEVELFQFKTVADPVKDENIEMTMEEAKKLDPEAQLGDSLGVKMDAKFGRIAAQAAKQVIVQKLRDAEREVIYTEFKDRIGELITGVIRRVEKTGDIIIDLGRTEAIIPRNEQVPAEHYKNGERVQGYFVEIGRGSGPQVILSRSHPMFVKRLFEIETPEISEGIVEIKSVARDPGARTKIAVYSRDSDVDPVGACVGRKGARVQTVVQELRGEKIDIVQWDDEAAKFVCNAIAPAEVSRIIIKDKEHKMEIVVPDDQLSLAIGKKGQNVRLAAMLTGWDLDVLSESRVEELTSRHKAALTKILGVDDGTALVLYGNGYRTVEDIAAVSEEEFCELPGMDKDSLKKIYANSVNAKTNGVVTASVIAEIIESAAAKAAAESAAAAALAAKSEPEAKPEEAKPEEAKKEPKKRSLLQLNPRLKFLRNRRLRLF